MYTYASNPTDYLSSISWKTSFSVLSKYLFAARQPHPHPHTTTIHDLPTELLEQIFIHYTHDYNDDDHSSHATRKRAIPFNDNISAHPHHFVNPLVLGHVCPRWMAISRELQSLWSRMYVREPSTKKQLQMAVYWLSLSGTSPLTLSLTMQRMASTSLSITNKGQDTAKADAVRKFVDLFLSHYDQWQRITIRLSQTSYLSSLLSSEKGRCLPEHAPPSLKHLDIDYGCWMMGDGPPSDDAIVQLYSAGGLDTLAWSAQWYTPTKLVSPEVFPHWASLKRLTYRQGYSANALEAADAVGLLACCPLLEEFDAMVYAEHGHGHVALDAPERVTHTHLRVLDVTLQPHTAAPLFDALCLPALEEVSIAFEAPGYDFGAMESAEPVLGMLERSGCRVQKLFFDCHGGPDDMLLEVLASHHLRYLKVLQLAGVRTGRAIELLTRREDAPESLSVLPNLERLEFLRSMYGEQPSTDIVERMLVSRTKKNATAAVVGKEKEDNLRHGRKLSALRHVELALGELGVLGYYRLTKLASSENRIILKSKNTNASEVCTPPFVQVLSGMRDWISPRRGFRGSIKMGSI